MELKTIIFFDEEQLYKERKQNGLEQWIQNLQAFFEIQAVTQAWFGAETCKNGRGRLLVTSCHDGLELAKQNGIPVLGFENKERLDASYLVLSLDGIDETYLEKVYRRQMGLPVTVIETKRCYLREITIDDLDDLYRIYEPPEMTEYMEPLFEDRKKEEEYTKAYIKNIYPFYGYGMWIVIYKENGEIIGRAGVDNHNFDGEAEPELGYMIAKEYQRKGLALEVCRGILSFMEKETGYERMNCLIERENKASVALTEKLGFQFLERRMINGKIMDRYTKTLHFF